MAGGLYLLLMWGYVVLQTPQLYAAFAALIMCTALLYWVSDARLDDEQSVGDFPNSGEDCAYARSTTNDEPSLAASMDKLNELKADLNQQYAQFGKDQSRLNSKSLGTWQKRRPD
jgi:hypothetical protein